MLEFYAGCISGLIQNIIGHPLDTMKVLAQNNKSIILKNPRNYYNGFIYPTTNLIFITGTVFEINKYFDNLYLSNYKSKLLSNYFSGFMSGLLTSPVIFLFDIGKIKSQMNQKVKIEHFYKTKGFFMTSFRESIAVSVYLGSYFNLRNEYNVPPFYAGGVAGLINWTLTYPIDIIKTRQMSENKSIMKALKMGYLWRGYSFCAIRAILVNSSGFMVYENSFNFLKKMT